MNWTIKNSSAINKEQASDPRIDSPHIKVMYPTEEQTSETTAPEDSPLHMQTKSADTASQQTSDSPQTNSAEPHTCKLSFQDAVKAHQVAFILIGLGILALGFIIGKNKV